MISLQKQRINTTISERYATIIYSFEFCNTRDTRDTRNHSDELRFAITIDPDAFIAGFTADINGELFIGRTEEKEEAKQEYVAAKEKNENAILISQPNKDISNVFQIKTNIDSGSKISLNITIEQYLKKTFNFNQLNIQILNDFNGTTISKNYSDIAYKFVVQDKRGIYDLTIPLYDGKIDNKNKYIYNINGNIISNQLSLTNELVLKYKVQGECDESSLLFDQKSNTFCHIISDIITDTEGNVDEKLKENIFNIPRRVVFVIDKSGSMRGNKWNYTVKATVMALKRLRNNIDRYRIVLCGSELDYIPKNINRLELVQESNINASIKYLQEQEATGCELLNKGLLEGIKAIKYDIIKLNNDKDVEYNFFMNQIIFISDGRPTIGETNVDKIITNVKNANDISKIDKYSNKISVFGFGVGSDGNGGQWMNDLPHAFLKSLSVNNNGFYKRIRQKTADTELTQYINIISNPISTNIQIEYSNNSNINKSTLTQTKFHSLYQGNDLIVCGKLDIDKHKKVDSINAIISSIICKENKPITIHKTIKIDIINSDIEEDEKTESNNVDRIWAYLSLQQHATKKLKYNDMIEIDDNEQKEKDKLPLQLAMKYKFVTPWTSMIVVKKKNENEEKDELNEDDLRSLKQTSTVETITLPASDLKGVKMGHKKGKSHFLKNLRSKVRSSAPTRMKPGMGTRMGRKAKPAMTRLKTVWITEKTHPFKELFQIGQKVVYGQFGKTFRCKRKKDKKISVVKCIPKCRFYRLDRSAQRRNTLLMSMKGEIDIMRRLKHKYIVNMEGSYEDKHTLYIVMEECKGGSLLDRMKEKQRYTEQEASVIIKMILEALFYMHDQHRMVHCELTPENILFVNSSENSPVKIIDFGMSKVLPRLRSSRKLCYPSYYTAPEFTKGDYWYMHLCDMWSVGVIMVVMMFGVPPFYVDPVQYYGQREVQAIYILIQKGFDPKWFAKQIAVSSESKDLMVGLMNSDCSKRLTAKEALQHPWILHELVDEVKQDLDKKQDPVIEHFMEGYSFKHVIANLFNDRYGTMRPEHFNHLKQIFQRLDVDGNGGIDLEEFKNGILTLKDLNCNEDYINSTFKAFDVGNFKIGKINFGCLINSLVHDYLVRSDQMLFEAFRDFDDNEDGKIKTSQLQAKIKQLDMYGKADELIKMIDSFDLDKDGIIEYEGFLRTIYSDYNEIPKWFWSTQMTQTDENKQDK